MIEAIRDYFIQNFSELNPNGRVGVDYLGDEPETYSIDSDVGGDPWAVRYVDGGGIRQYGFTLTSREYYGSDSNKNTENLKFYEYISNRIEELNDVGIVPDVQGAYMVEVLTTGYLFSSQDDRARYQIQLKLKYTV